MLMFFLFALLLHVHIWHMPSYLRGRRCLTWIVKVLTRMPSLKTLKSSNCHLLCWSCSWLGAQSRLMKWWFAMQRQLEGLGTCKGGQKILQGRCQDCWRSKGACYSREGLRHLLDWDSETGQMTDNPVNFAIISSLCCRLPGKAPKRLWKKRRRTQTHTCMMYTV